MKRWRLGKRVIDIITSILLLVLTSGVIMVIMLINTLTLKNPFFTQRRIGKGGNEFTLLKLRSMGPDGQINRFNSIIRAIGLDELPQLLNVLQGKMSIVGPRPMPSAYLEYLTVSELKRHDVKPGITGLAQINGRNHLSWDEKFTFDLEYVSRYSFIVDAQIIIKTIFVVLNTNIVAPSLIQERRAC